MCPQVRLSQKTKERKLTELAKDCGMSVDELIEKYALDSIVPAICVNSLCDYTDELEPDGDGGWCPECETETLVSALVLAGFC